MLPAAKRRLAKILSFIVGLAGVMVIVGWIFDITALKSISSSWISMKFDTAVSFVLSAITMYFMARAFEGEFDKAQVVISMTSLILMLLMGTLFFSHFLNVRTGAEEIFIKEVDLAPDTVVPGRPSAPTMLNFMLIALAGIMTMFRYSRLNLVLNVIGLTITVIGVMPVVGYIMNIPILYYFVEGVNSAMALHTAVLFILIGAGFVCLSD